MIAQLYLSNRSEHTIMLDRMQFSFPDNQSLMAALGSLADDDFGPNYKSELGRKVLAHTLEYHGAQQIYQESQLGFITITEALYQAMPEWEIGRNEYDSICCTILTDLADNLTSALDSLDSISLAAITSSNFVDNWASGVWMEYCTKAQAKGIITEFANRYLLQIRDELLSQRNGEDY